MPKITGNRYGVPDVKPDDVSNVDKPDDEPDNVRAPPMLAR